MFFNITPKKQENLKAKMQDLGIKEKDLVERFIRASGRGGQNVNKVATCVYIKHIPTGLEVKCQRERSQSVNRFLARRMIAGKVENLLLGKLSEEKKRIEKIRRQKRKRSKRAKEKMLNNKRKQGEKKTLRKTPGVEE